MEYTFRQSTWEERWNKTTTLTDSDRPRIHAFALSCGDATAASRHCLRSFAECGWERLTCSPEPGAPRPRAKTRNSTACHWPPQALSKAMTEEANTWHNADATKWCYMRNPW